MTERESERKKKVRGWRRRVGLFGLCSELARCQRDAREPVGKRGVYVVFVNHAPDTLPLGESSQVALHETLLEEVCRHLLLAVHLRDWVLLV